MKCDCFFRTKMTVLGFIRSSRLAIVCLTWCWSVPSLWAQPIPPKKTSPAIVVAPPRPPEVVNRSPIQWLTVPSHMAVQPRLKIQLSGLLTPKQISILQGGFTTVSQLVIHLPRNLGEDPELLEEDDDGSAMIAPLRQVTCSAKFDAWQESYEVLKLLDVSEKTPSKPVTINSIESYGDLCLTSELEIENSLKPLASQGGVLLATMIVKQTSLEETAKIKDWLIQQQSGVIQGLFSHMLGELTLQQTVRTTLVIPPLPASALPALPTKPGQIPPRTQHFEKHHRVGIPVDRAWDLKRIIGLQGGSSL